MKGPVEERVLPSASALREEIFEEDRRRTGVEIASTAKLRLARGMPLVIEPYRKPEFLRRGRETPHALRLVPHLAAEGQRQPDHQCVDLLVARDALELREVLDDASSHESAERSREAMCVIANSEADAAIADVQRKVAHELRRARGRR